MRRLFRKRGEAGAKVTTVLGPGLVNYRRALQRAATSQPADQGNQT